MSMATTRASISRAGYFTVAAVMTLYAPVVDAAPSVASQAVSLDDFRQFKQSSPWVVLADKLHSWSVLEADWDSEGAVPPARDAIATARKFLNDLEWCGAPIPRATIAGDGEIAFEWSKNQSFASVSFTTDGHVIAYLREDADTPALRVDELAGMAPLGPFLERIGAFA